MEFLGNGVDDWVEFIFAHRNHGLIFLTGEEPQDDGTVDVRSQGFACFSFGTQASKLVGAFDENFAPAYYEDFAAVLALHGAGARALSGQKTMASWSFKKLSFVPSVDVRV